MDAKKVDMDREEKITHLLEVLRHRNADMRWQAAAALGRLRAERAVPNLIAVLGDSDEQVRWNAAYALGKLGDGNGKAVDSLVAALDDPSDSVRKQAAFALGRIGDAGAGKGVAGAGMAEVIDALEAVAAGDREESVRRQAMRSLEMMQERAADAND